MNGTGQPNSRDEVREPNAPPERHNPLEKKNRNTPEKLFPVHCGGKREDGNLIRPAENAGKRNPLISNDGIAGQLFGLGGKMDGDSNGPCLGGDQKALRRA